MAGKTEKKSVETKTESEINFICKFCGESKPLSELVVMRHYYPQIAACKKCARGTKEPAEEESTADKTQE